MDVLFHTISMVRLLLIAGLCCGLSGIVTAHNIGATPVTWNREISRLVYDKCASCHRPGGTAFSMMTYQDVQPRLVEIKAAVLNRRMPPWGAIKGFGDFKNEQALTQEQIELIVDWIQNDGPRGNNRRALPAEPSFATATSARASGAGEERARRHDPRPATCARRPAAARSGGKSVDSHDSGSA
jgi:mono/diheme cytochrome c family protein